MSSLAEAPTPSLAGCAVAGGQPSALRQAPQPLRLLGLVSCSGAVRKTLGRKSGDALGSDKCQRGLCSRWTKAGGSFFSI